MSEYKLTEGIVNLSEASTWDEAKLEWDLETIYWVKEPSTCLCGHFPINEICVLRNRHNHQRTEVGNVCVKKFLGLPSDKIFRGINRVAKDVSKALNAEAIDYAHRQDWIDDWQRGFCFDTMRKRKLSERQLAIRKRINRRVLRKARPQ